MARVFLSHSSKDKEFARRLAEDLRKLEHQPWLDEWEIRVGHSIPGRIEKGLAETDFLAIILSKSAVESAWVEKEWRTKYWDEVESRETRVLPLLLEDCRIPDLLKEKRYADFRVDYEIALVSLHEALLSPVLREGSGAGDRREQARCLGDLFHEVLEDLEEHGGGYLIGLPTGFVGLDRCTLGLQRRTLSVLGGESKSGRTSFLLSVALFLAAREDRNVLFCSQGIGAPECVVRIICASCRIPVRRFHAGHLKQSEWTTIISTVRELSAKKLWIDDSPSCSVEMIRRLCTSGEAFASPDLVIIDDCDRFLFAQDDDLEHVIEELRLLPRELDVPVLGAVRLMGETRGREGRELRPDERQRTLLGAADIGMRISVRDDVTEGLDNSSTLVRLELCQNRFGELGGVDLLFNRAHLQFYNLDERFKVSGIETRGQ